MEIHFKITISNISILKNGKAKAVRMETLDKICAALDCQPGDILEYIPGPADETGAGTDGQNEGGN